MIANRIWMHVQFLVTDIVFTFIPDQDDDDDDNHEDGIDILIFCLHSSHSHLILKPNVQLWQPTKTFQTCFQIHNNLWWSNGVNHVRCDYLWWGWWSVWIYPLDQGSKVLRWRVEREIVNVYYDILIYSADIRD